MNIRVLVAALSSAAVLLGCSAGGNAILQTLPYAYKRSPGVDDAKLNPNFHYLRVTTGGRVALLALGELDRDERGQIEVWYSAEREVLRLQNGRLVGAVGLTTEWRNVALPELPSWSAAARNAHGFRWTRARDVMPGYRFGVKDVLALRVIATPQRSALRGLDPDGLAWFEERVVPETVARRSAIFGDRIGVDDTLPPARFAVDVSGARDTVVYGEQCLAADLCFTWQRWPVRAQSAAGQTQ